MTVLIVKTKLVYTSLFIFLHRLSVFSFVSVWVSTLSIISLIPEKVAVVFSAIPEMVDTRSAYGSSGSARARPVLLGRIGWGLNAPNDSSEDTPGISRRTSVFLAEQR